MKSEETRTSSPSSYACCCCYHPPDFPHRRRRRRRISLSRFSPSTLAATASLQRAACTKFSLESAASGHIRQMFSFFLSFFLSFHRSFPSVYHHHGKIQMGTREAGFSRRRWDRETKLLSSGSISGWMSEMSRRTTTTTLGWTTHTHTNDTCGSAPLQHTRIDGWMERREGEFSLDWQSRSMSLGERRTDRPADQRPSFLQPPLQMTRETGTMLNRISRANSIVNPDWVSSAQRENARVFIKATRANQPFPDRIIMLTAATSLLPSPYAHTRCKRTYGCCSKFHPLSPGELQREWMNEWMKQPINIFYTENRATETTLLIIFFAISPQSLKGCLVPFCLFLFQIDTLLCVQYVSCRGNSHTCGWICV